MIVFIQHLREKMNIFIIGGAGYIGSHMVKIAHNAGHKVITLDNLSTGHQSSVLYGEFEFCDILNSFELDKLFKKHNPDAVMHFSACSIVGESVINPHKYYQNNITGSLNLFKAMVDNNCKKLILVHLLQFLEIHNIYQLMKSIPKNLSTHMEDQS